MKKALLGCEVIKEELETIVGDDYPDLEIIWLGSQLHEHPDMLKEKIQATVNELDDYEMIALSYGLCGQATLGIEATHCDIYFPLIDDCINGLMLCSEELPQLRASSIFTSRGWLSTSFNNSEQYIRMVEKYGEKRTRRLFASLYKNYKNLVYMKTEDTISADNWAKALSQAEIQELELITKKASIDIYKELIEFKQTENIGVIHKGQFIEYAMYNARKR